MRTSLLSAIAGLAVTASMLLATPITYQGRLIDASMPATGSYQMIFRVYSAAIGGDLLATAPTVTVAALDGLIVATPDFPAATFTGATVYLDISLRRSGGTSYTSLGQRQAITPAPLAMRSLNERWTVLSSTAIRTDPAVTNVLINTGTSIRADAPLVVGRTTSTSTDLAGMFVNTSAAASKSYYGWATGGVPRAEAHVTSTSQFQLFQNAAQTIDILPSGNVGLGTAATSSDRLRVNGAASILAGLNVAGYTSMVNAGASGDIIANGTMSANVLHAATDVTANGTVAGLAVNATNITATTYAFATTPTKRINIPPEAFRPSAPNLPAYFGAATGIAYFDASVGAAGMVAPVYLPHNATILSVDMVFLDNSATADIAFYLYRRHPIENAYSILSWAESAGANASVNAITGSAVTIPLVSNVYNYSLNVYSSDWQGGVMGVKNIQIRYTVPGPD